MIIDMLVYGTFARSGYGGEKYLAPWGALCQLAGHEAIGNLFTSEIAGTRCRL